MPCRAPALAVQLAAGVAIVAWDLTEEAEPRVEGAITRNGSTAAVPPACCWHGRTGALGVLPPFRQLLVVHSSWPTSLSWPIFPIGPI